MKYLGMDIPLDDKPTYDFLCSGENLKGIFQFETHSAGFALKKIKPRNITDLSLVTSLNRPGSIKFLDAISDIRDGKKTIEYLDIALEPFLKDTYGSLVYQESVMQIAQKLAGFKATESNALLKALGKKKMDVMKGLRDHFVEGMKQNGYKEELSNKIFDWFIDFANYSFNASHATGYSLFGYLSAYVKLHHPKQFLCSLLNYSQYEQSPLEEIFDIFAECGVFGVKLLPPTVSNRSKAFTIESDGIRFPLSLIRGVAELTWEKIEGLPRHSLDAFLEASFTNGINKRVMEFLIISGALDKFGEREDILLQYQFLNMLSAQEDAFQRFLSTKSGQPFSVDMMRAFLNNTEVTTILVNGRSRKLCGSFKTDRTRKKFAELMEKWATRIEQYKKHAPFIRFIWENFVLGFSTNLKFHDSLSTYSEIEKGKLGSYTTCGFVDEVDVRESKRSGDKYALLHLKYDRRQSFIVFGDVFNGCEDVIQPGDFIQLEVTKRLQEDKKTHKRVEKINVDSVKLLRKAAESAMFWNIKEKSEEKNIVA